MPRRLLMAVMIWSLGLICLVNADEPPKPGKQVAAKFVSRADSASSLGYWLYLPKEHGTGDKRWPVMLFLHGSGERGADLKAVKVHGPPKLIDQGREFPCIVVSPQCPKDHSWSGEIQQHLLAELIDAVVREQRGDPSRIYVTGLSMGGYGTWELTARHPDWFAAAVPICGRGDPATGERLKPVPFWVFHGAKDGGVPLKYSEEMVEAVTKAGGRAKLTIYPEAGHDSWTETYQNPAVYEWLLEHRLGAVPQGAMARADVAFTEIGSIKSPIGDPAAKSTIEVSVYASTQAASSSELKAAVESQRAALLAAIKTRLLVKSVEELKGPVGLRQSRADVTKVIQTTLREKAPPNIEALFDVYSVK